MKRIWAAAALVILAAGCGRVTGIPGRSVGSVLTPEQRFSLKSADGGVLELSALLAKNKLVLLNFWATWCTYCVEEMPDLIRLQEKHGPAGFTVIAVNVGETPEQARVFAEKMNLNFPVALDTDMATAQSYGLVGIPVSYLIDPAGRILGEYHGFTPKMVSDIEKNLEDA